MARPGCVAPHPPTPAASPLHCTPQAQKQGLRAQLEAASKTREAVRASLRDLKSNMKFTSVEQIDETIASLGAHCSAAALPRPATGQRIRRCARTCHRHACDLRHRPTSLALRDHNCPAMSASAPHPHHTHPPAPLPCRLPADAHEPEPG